MTKRQLIDEIVELNPTAQPEFLAKFEDGDLVEYLDHLGVLRQPRLSGDPHRYDKYFEDCPFVPMAVGAVEVQETRQAETDQIEYDYEDLEHQHVTEFEQQEEAGELVTAGVAQISNADSEVQMPFANTEEESESWLF